MKRAKDRPRSEQVGFDRGLGNYHGTPWEAKKGEDKSAFRVQCQFEDALGAGDGGTETARGGLLAILVVHRQIDLQAPRSDREFSPHFRRSVFTSLGPTD